MIKTAFHLAALSLLISSPPVLALDLIEVYDSLRSGNRAAVESLLDQGASPDLRDSGGNTLLMQAAFYGSLDTLQLLIDRGADVNATNNAGATALMRAAASPAKMNLLLAHGADVNARSSIGNSPLILAARARGSAKSLELLLNLGAEINATNIFGASALMAAAASSDLESVRLLVKRGADVNPHLRGEPHTFIFGGGRSPLMWTAFLGDRSMAKFLLDSGAEINSPELFGSALTQTAWGDQPAMARFLLKHGANVNQPDFGSDFTPLHWAAHSERPSSALTKLLLDHGANPNAEGGEPIDAFMGIPQTPLMHAKKRGETEIVRVLRAAGAGDKADNLRPSFLRAESREVTTETLRAALADAIPPLVETARFSRQAFLRHSSKQDCVSCHQQYMPLAAMAYAKSAGVSVDRAAEAEILQMVQTDNSNNDEIAAQATFHPDPAHSYGYGIFALSAQKQPPTPGIDAIVHHFLVIQGRDGQWHNNLPRPPIQTSDIGATALAVNTLKSYGFPGRQDEIQQRIARARKWLADATPLNTDERAYQILGLVWSGEKPQIIQKFARELLQEQRSDGGWAQLPNLESDAYATGLSLFALFQASQPKSDPQIRRGLAFLLNNQAEDGTWHVRTRAFPFQPTMRSGFPYSRDSWISAHGSSWAAIAMASALNDAPIHLSAAGNP